MYLRTLGRLELEGTSFQRPKPLLLLAYLAVEGPKPRRTLADLFFMDTADAFNSLSRAISYLRRDAPGSIESDEKRVWTTLGCDVKHLLALLETKDLEGAIALYNGMFLEGFDLPLGEELEEWLYAKREHLAGRVQSAMLTLAEQSAARGDFASASKRAEQAYLLESAPEPEPEALSRFYALFVAGNSSYVAQVRATAKEFDIDLSQTTLQSQQRLHKPFLGRKRELERLARLETGQWAWVRGGSGIGKTSLLQQLQGQYVPGRMGLPYATLEPLVSDLLNDGAEAILRRLSKQEKTLCIDDWENIDAESQDILKRLRTLKPNLKVIVSGVSSPPFAVDVLLELSTLPREALEATSELWEKTGGVPKLVNAHLQGESLAEALEATLSALPEHTRNVYLSLALLEEPDPSLVRKALGLSAGEMAVALKSLLSAGLAAPSGRVWPRQVAREYLNDHPILLGQLALRLAKLLEDKEAFLFYQVSKTLWAEDDLEAVQRAYIAWANEVLKRGFPKRAVEILEEAPSLPSAELLVLKARALEYVGDHQTAFETLEGLDETLEVLSLKGMLYWRLNNNSLARKCAGKAIKGNIEERAEALNTLGAISLTEGKYHDAETYFRRVVPLWHALGRHEQWVRSLNNLVMALHELNQDFSSQLQLALEASQDYHSVRSLVLLTYSYILIDQNRVAEAEQILTEAIAVAKEAGVMSNESLAWNNLGVIYHKAGQTNQALEAYSKALHASQQTKDKSDIGLILANIAELQQDPIALEEALVFLEDIDHAVQAQQIRKSLLATTQKTGRELMVFENLHETS
jgi:tetratricopeptide (TPR) repeat protein